MSIGFKNPSHSLRQLLDVSALQKAEIVIRILLVEESDCLAIFQIKQVKKVHRKLIRRFGGKSAFTTELSSYHPTKDKPYA